MTEPIPRDLPPLDADREAVWQSQIDAICRLNRPTEFTEDDTDWPV